MTTENTNTLMLLDPQPKHKAKAQHQSKLNDIKWKLQGRTPEWVQRFLKRHGILLASFVFFFVWTITCVSITRNNTTAEVTERLEAQFAAEMEAYKHELEVQHQAESLLVGDASKQAAIQEVATIMAKSFYGHRNVVTSDNDYYTLGWNEWFRVASGGEFANQKSLHDVVSAPNAYMGYSDDNPTPDNMMAIATKICTDYFDGNWPTTEQFVYLDWSSGKMIARNEYKTTPSTEYWWYGK